jgi:3-hydroxybutyryl-CoA dehydrogenase
LELTEITRIGVVGAGTMGAGIAEVFAEAGYEVLWYNRSAAGMQRGLARLRANQATLIRHGVCTQEAADRAWTRLHPTHTLQALAGVDLVSESITEHLEAKQGLFHALSRICQPPAILTTNTSGLSISQIAAAVAHPGRFAGMHFTNPPHILPLVEIVQGAETDKATCTRLLTLARRLHKRPIWVKQDIPGFIANRLQFALLREALHLVETGVASPADIDAAVKHCIGLRWALLGPLEIADVGGLDVFHAIGTYLLPALSQSSAVAKILQDCVAAGKLGAKSGAGFYTYAAGQAEQLVAERDALLLRLLHLKQTSALDGRDIGGEDTPGA